MSKRGRDDPRGLTAEQVIENIALFPLKKDFEYDERGRIKSGCDSYSAGYAAFRNQQFARRWLELRRATSAEQERDELRGLLLLCGELGGIGKDETPVAYLRRLIDGLIDAGRERDEAYERAAQCAECIADEYDATSFTSVVAGQVAALRSKEQAAHEIAAAIRRLAAGTEKEGE